MIRIATIATALLYCVGAYAQTPALTTPPARPAPLTKPAPPAQEPSAYCRAGAAALFQGSGDAEMATVQQSCRRGDIIAISAAAQGSVFQIGRLCDFSKAIVNTGGQVLCALTGTRGIR
jgi:hypothetical protein